MRHLTPKTLTQLRKAGDVWECPGCGADNIHSINYIEQVLHGRGLTTLLKNNHVAAVEELPIVTGSGFENRCGACGDYFAPKRIGGRRNPILHPANTHEESRGVPGYSNYGGGGPFAPMASPRRRTHEED